MMGNERGGSMNALEELRQMADLQECGRAFVEIGQLRDIADRIESEWMELPRDANEKVVDPRKTNERVWRDGMPYGAYQLSLDFRGWNIVNSDGIHTTTDTITIQEDSWGQLFDDVQRVGHMPHNNDGWIARAKALAGESE